MDENPLGFTEQPVEHGPLTYGKSRKIIQPLAGSELAVDPAAPQPPVEAVSLPSSPPPQQPVTLPPPGPPAPATPPPAPPEPITPPPAVSPPGQTNEPAPSQPYISNPFSLFSLSWEAFKLNFLTWLLFLLLYLGVFLLFFIIPSGFFFAAIFSHSRSLFVISLVVELIAFVAFIIFAMSRFAGAMTVLILASVRGVHTDLKPAFDAGRPYGWRLVGFSLIYVFMLLFGFLLFIVPGVLVLVWYGFTPYLIVDENLSIGEAMKRSKQLVKGRFWEVYGVNALIYAFGILNIIPFVGAIAAGVLEVVYTFAIPIRYVMLKSYRDSDTELPPISAANYIIPIVQFIMLILTIFLVGFVMLSLLNDLNHASIKLQTSPSFSSTQPSVSQNLSVSSNSASGATSSSLAPGEQLSKPPERRPAQYLHVCDSSDGISYVSQGNPKCLAGDSFQFDYSPSVAGTVYSTPCQTTGGSLLRYVYIANDTSCPSGTISAL